MTPPCADADVIGDVRLLRVVVREIHQVGGDIDRSAPTRPDDQAVQAEVLCSRSGPVLPLAELL